MFFSILLTSCLASLPSVDGQRSDSEAANLVAPSGWMSTAEDAWFVGDNTARRHFQEAKHHLNFDLRDQCAADVRKAAAIVQLAGRQETNPECKAALMRTVLELEQAGTILEDTDCDMKQELSNVFARAELRLSRHYFKGIGKHFSDRDYLQSARVLRATLGHLEGAMYFITYQPSLHEVRVLAEEYRTARELREGALTSSAIRRVETALYPVIAEVEKRVDSLPALDNTLCHASSAHPLPDTPGYPLAEDAVFDAFLTAPRSTCRASLSSVARDKYSECQRDLKSILAFLEMQVDRTKESSTPEELARSVKELQNITDRLGGGKSVEPQFLIDHFANATWSLSRLYCNDAMTAWTAGESGRAARRLWAAKRQLDISLSWRGIGIPIDEEAELDVIEDASRSRVQQKPKSEDTLHLAIANLDDLIDRYRLSNDMCNERTLAVARLGNSVERSHD